MEPIVKFNNVSKIYSFYKNQSEKLYEILSVKKKKKSFSALKNVSFEVNKGESIGVIGINGSGKSTLSNLLAQVLEPTSGTVEIKGDPYLIAIQAGLNNSLTGIENIELKCLMLGLKKEEIKEITPEIIDFADIGDFISQPVKNYSSGMKSRLGFAISVHINPDILIIDEALSVGDQTFYDKCLNKIMEFKQQGKTIFFISHSISQVQAFSDRVLWLHFGKVKEFGEKKEVLTKYQEFIKWFNTLSESEKKAYRKSMLQEQVEQKITDLTSNRKERFKKSKDKKSEIRRIFNFLQLFVLLTLLGLSVFFMFSIDTVRIPQFDVSFLKKENKKIPSETKLVDKNETIQSNGFVIADKISVFSDSDLNNMIFMLPFGSPIYIIEKVNNILKVRVDGKEGYINNQNVEISKSTIISLQYNIEYLLHNMPNAFSRAYSFYLAHIGMSYDEIKDNLRGLSSETINPYGNKVQIYGSENIMYNFDKNNIANSITVNNINTENEALQELIEQAQVKNNELQLYSISINGYKIVVDLINKNMKIEPIIP